MTINLKFITLYLVLVIFISKDINAADTEHCPSYCKCDLFENLNRADCSEQQLISPNVEVPNAVELLNLSHNDITTLDNVCFEGLIYIINLTISHNALHTIYLDSFSSLRQVEFIDLSYNRLEYFDERIFETNTKLTKLDLSGNKFMSLQNKPLLRSSTIKYLRLNGAQVTYIYPQTFKEIPNLQEVDISNNLMITLSATAFNSLHNLKSINLEQNRWICDNGFDATLKLLKRKGVEINLQSCEMKFEMYTNFKTNQPRMFERMMVAPPSTTTSRTTVLETEPKEFIPIENVWKTKKPIDSEMDEAEACEEQSLTKICHLHRSCLANLKILIRDKTAGEVIRRGKYTDEDLMFVFFTGTALGIAIFICLMTCALCMKRCFSIQKKLPQRQSEVVSTIQVRRRPPPSPAIPPRQRRSNRRSRNPAPSLNRSLSSPVRRGPHSDGNQSDFATFLTRLFERPTRHQYYRTINENTAHMIRRLSQSNLFNNRRSRNFSETPNDSTEGAEQSEPFVYPSANENSDCRREPQQRPETPPPAYGDVIN